MTTMPGGLVPEWTVGDRLRKAREITGLDQRQFAERLGVSRQTITNAEKGHVAVRKITLNAWALSTGVPVEWLEYGVTTSPGGPDSDTRRYSKSPGHSSVHVFPVMKLLAS